MLLFKYIFIIIYFIRRLCRGIVISLLFLLFIIIVILINILLLLLLFNTTIQIIKSSIFIINTSTPLNGRRGLETAHILYVRKTLHLDKIIRFTLSILAIFRGNILNFILSIFYLHEYFFLCNGFQ